ncbi:MAG: TRAP transporter small permease [Burkholderiales bacterium]|nr:TRAP transporter small permease [Burkholderiales bacterium]
MTYKLLGKLAGFCAILAGLLLTVITLMTCLSVLGRNTTGDTLVGDFELTGVAAGAAIALFLPWCQLRRGNIIVDFFTSGASPRTTAVLDRIGALVLGLCMALLAWRTVLGGLSAWRTQSATMMLGFPEWMVYTLMVPPLILTALIGLCQGLMGFEQEAQA